MVEKEIHLHFLLFCFDNVDKQLQLYCEHPFEWNAIAKGLCCLFCCVIGVLYYYDPQSGQGYLAYRLKTVQRNTSSDFKSSPKSARRGGPKNVRETLPLEQLFGDECKEAMSLMKHSSDKGS